MTLFHNPAAGDMTIGAEELESILSDAGYQVRYQSTKKRWRSALDDPGELAIAAGGDGTIAMIARAVADTDLPLAVLPFGTANNIAKSIGAFGDIATIVASWRHGAVRSLDVGVVSGPFGEERFIEAVGGGVFADLIRRGSSEVEDAPAMVGRETDRALQLLRHILETAEAGEWELALDDYDLSGTYLAVEAMNVGFAGPNVPLASDALVDDGELDLVLVREEDRARLLQYLTGRVESASALMPSLDVRRGRTVRMVPPKAWSIRVDDELRDVDGQAVDVLVRPRAVRLVGGRSGASGA